MIQLLNPTMIYTEDKIQLSFQKHQKELEEFDNILNEPLNKLHFDLHNLY